MPLFLGVKATNRQQYTLSYYYLSYIIELSRYFYLFGKLYLRSSYVPSLPTNKWFFLLALSSFETMAPATIKALLYIKQQ